MQRGSNIWFYEPSSRGDKIKCQKYLECVDVLPY